VKKFSSKEKKSTARVAVLGRKLSQKFLNKETFISKMNRVNNQIAETKEQLHSSETNLLQIEQKRLKEFYLSESLQKSSNDNTIDINQSELYSESLDLLLLNKEIFGDGDNYMSLTETEEERSKREYMESKLRELRLLMKVKEQLTVEQWRKIREEEELIKKLEFEILQEETEFDREMERRRSKREDEDDYDWDEVTDDPWKSDDSQELDDETKQELDHQNEDIKRLEAEVFQSLYYH